MIHIYIIEILIYILINEIWIYIGINKIRIDIIPALNDINPCASGNILKMSQRMIEVEKVVSTAVVPMHEMLVEENIKAIQTNSEVAKVMAEHEVKVENAVDELYNKIMGGTVNG